MKRITAIRILALVLSLFCITPALGEAKAEDSILDAIEWWEPEEETTDAFSASNVVVGNTIEFGMYEQDNDTDNGPEPIEWIVLKNDGDTATLISKYGLDCKRYNTTYRNVTWETCTLRKWLNNDFYNKAFSANEQEWIVESRISNPSNGEYGTAGGTDTQDKVFLLSIDEANRLFASDNARKCKPTQYAANQGVWTNSDGTCWWWLRSPGSGSNRAAIVNYDGSVDYLGNFVNYDHYAVRPAVVLRLS